MRNLEESLAYQAWIHSQLEDERLYVGRRTPRPIPHYAVKFPEELISKAPPEITDKEWEIKEDEWLRLKGIK